jgi:hypothetical protein
VEIRFAIHSLDQNSLISHYSAGIPGQELVALVVAGTQGEALHSYAVLNRKKVYLNSRVAKRK